MKTIEALENILRGSIEDLSQPGAIRPGQPLDLEIARVLARREAFVDVLNILQHLSDRGG